MNLMNFQFSILEFLFGTWTYKREFDNGCTGSGTVNFTKNKFYGLKYSEHGSLKLVEDTVLTVKRKYYFNNTGNNLEIFFFETPKILFQRIELKIKDGNIFGKATHHCVNDFYNSK